MCRGWTGAPGVRAGLGVLLLLALGACGSVVPHAEPGRAVTRGVCAQLAAEFGAPTLAFPQTAAQVESLAQNDLLVLMVESPRRPILRDPEVKLALQKFVYGGGRLLLLGYAAALVHELGIEPKAPDRCAPYRWGDDRHTALGRYEFGFYATEHTVSTLLHDLQAVPGGDQAFHLGGGTGVDAPCCHWEAEDPSRGLVLGRLHRNRDGELRDLDSVVLCYWQYGTGGVLAYGNLPEPWREDERIRHNAEAFLRNAVRSLGRGRSQSLAVCLLPAGQTRADTDWSLPPVAERPHPGRSLLPHWGWQVALNQQHDGATPIELAMLVNQVLRPSAVAGADRLQLRIGDLQRGYPLDWPGDDPINRPASYRGGPFWRGWDAVGLRRLSQLAGQFGVSLDALLDVDLAPSGTPAEAAEVLRFLSRELFDPRLHREAAWSGLSLDVLLPPEGLPGLLQAAAPGASLSLLREQAAPENLARVLHARRGQPRGLRSNGLSASWRALFAPVDYPLGVLDARSRQPDPSRWQGLAGDGTGSYPDWILTQLHHFVRHRKGLGAGVTWQAWQPQRTDAATQDYVTGLSMLPIKAAFAGRLWATGKGGYRELSAQQLGAVQEGYGAESPLPAATPVLQNNHFRLHGFNGPLQVDPAALARFCGPDVPAPAAQPFMQTRWQRLKYDLELEPAREIDFVSTQTRGEGGYAEVCKIAADQRGGASFPGRLALGAAGRWPQAVELEFIGFRTNYSLELQLRSLGGPAVLELRREGRLLQVLGVDGQETPRVSLLPFPVAEGGLRRFSLWLVEGQPVEVLSCRLRPQGSLPENNAVPTEVRVEERAGARASLVSVSGSKVVNETRRLVTHADFPGFLLSIRYGALSRGLRDERQFGLGGYRKVVRTFAQQGRSIRGGIILAHEDAAQPRLLVLPLLPLPRYHHFRWDAEEQRLSLRGAPGSKMELQLGFLFLHGLDGDDLDAARAMLLGLLKLPEQELDPDGRATLRPVPAPAHARVLRLLRYEGTPLLVREGEVWYQRGTRPARRRGHLLHLYQLDEQAVQIHAVTPALKLPHAAPGSAGSICWRRPESHRVEVEVLEAGPLLAAPGIVMPVAFNKVRVNGRSWRYFQGRTVLLPRRPGRYQVEVGTRVEQFPQLLRTDLSVELCQFLPEQSSLALSFVDFVPGSERFIWVSGQVRTALGAEVLLPEQLGYTRAQTVQAGTEGSLLRVQDERVVLLYHEAAQAMGGGR